ncbi:hypothetical protein BH09BAC1_BH09BAC1_06190 [soil metagenome]
MVLVLTLGSNALYYLVQLPVVQNWLIQKVTTAISEKIKADVTVGHIEIRFFTHMSLEDFLVKDQAGDTLLYAKSLDMGITNFQPLKKRIFLSDIRLENPTIHLYRPADREEFNFQFIIDSLSMPAGEDESEPYDIRFENVFFSNLAFRMDDSVTQQSMHIAFTNLGIEGDEINILNRRLGFKKIELDGTAINYQDFSPWAYFVNADFKDEHERLLQAAQEMLNTDCWELSVGQLAITNSSFKYDMVNRPRDLRGIDYSHIAVENVNLDFRNVRLLEDTIFAHIESFTAAEQCGFKVVSLQADAQVSPVKMEFKNLHLVTPNSDITEYYSMEFKNLYAFNEYETEIVMTGRFDQAKVSVRDINYFAKVLNPIVHNNLLVTGEITGSVDNLKGRDLVIEYGKLSRFEGNMSFKGLPNINGTFISFNIKRIRTTAPELRALIPSVFLPVNLDKLGLVRFSGKFDGFVNDFVAEGELISQIGNVKSDINFKLNERGEPSYAGHLSTTKFNLGKWLDNDLLGEVTATAKVDGEGLTLATLKATAQGKLKNIVFKGYEYKDVDIDGSIARRKFNGSFKVRDEHLDMDFAGAFNLADSIPIFNFSAVVRNADLLPLHLWHDNISFSSNMSLDISGDKLDNLNGELHITETNITKGDTAFYLENLFFEAYESGQSKVLSLRSDIANGWVEGNYNFADLPVAGRYFLEHYFNPGFIDTVSGTGKMVQQDMKFEIKFENTRNLTQLFYPRLKNIAGGKIVGAFDSGKNNLDLTVDIPSITLDKLKLGNISLVSGTQFGMVGLYTSVDSIFYDDSLVTEKFVLDAGIIKDSVVFSLTLEDTLSPTNLNLSGSLKTDFENIFVQFRDSKIRVEGTEWIISDDNHFVFDGKTLDVKDMTLRNGLNELSLNSYIVNGTTHLNLAFHDIMLKEFIPKLHIITGLEMDGRLNGSINVMSLMNNPTLMANISVDSFTIEGDLLGNVKVQSTLKNGAEQLQVRAMVEGPGNMATITGNIGLTAGAPLDFSASIEAFNLAFVEKFAAGLVDKVHGSASGLIYLKGKPNEPLLTGNLKLNDAGARMVFLNTEYSFTNQVLQLKENSIELGKIKMKDQQGNTAILAGQILHTHLRDWKFNMDLETDNFQFLNTGLSSTDAFYGKIFAKGYVFIMGTLDLVELYVSAKTTKGTQFYIPVSSSRDVGEYTFYQFINTDTTRTDKPKNFTIKTTGVRLNLDIEVTPDAEVNLILSEEQGDVISARGNGNILVGYDELENMTMMGNYEVVSGDYTFSMQNIISKKFDIKAGSQILWTGDPYDARLAVKAVYKLRAAPYDLIGDVLREDAPIQQSRSRIPTYLYLNLNGSLLSPDISFDIAVPDADAAIRNALDAKLTMIRLDQQELNKQVVGLLVLNRFLPSAPLGSSPNSNVAMGMNNTVSEFLSNQLSLYLTDWISKFVTEVDLDINFRNYQSTGTTTPATGTDVNFQNRRELQLALTKSFFNNRVEVDLGGNFDFGDASGNTTNSNSTVDPNNPGATNNRIANNVAGDFEIRYNIANDGRIKLKVFRKGQYDVFQERNRNRTGVGIAYRREFDSLKEIIQGFKNKRHRRQTKREEAQRIKQLKLNPPEPPTEEQRHPMPEPLDLGGL